MSASPQSPSGSGVSRRRLFQLGAGGAGLAVAGSLLPPSVQQALASPPRRGGLKAIKHVVVLVQENRSFDHYYGTLRGVRGFGDRNAIRLRDGRSVFEQPGGPGGHVLPFPVRKAAQDASKDLQYIGDLPHGWTDGHKALNDGWNDGWIGAKTPATMAHYDRVDLPFHYELADTFTICDAYHCALPSSTSPNRNYLVSGYTGFEPGSTTQRAISNAAYSEDSHAGYSWSTYAEELERAGRSWKVYQEWDNYQDNNLEFYVSFKRIARKALAAAGDFKSLDSFYGKLAGLPAAEQDVMLAKLEQGVAGLPAAERSLYERGLRRGRPQSLAASLRADIDAGTLPEVSYLVPSAADSEHPGASSPAASATITYQVLDAIASNREVWDSTVVLLTFDENDGFFDHVPTPRPPEEVTDEYFDGKPIGFGARVPMVVVSPWTVGGYVSSETFDHTSVTRFLETWTGVRAPDISNWRRTVSGDMTGVFDFDRARRSQVPPRPAPAPAFTSRWRPAPPATQKLPEPERGRRPARALPYQPDAWARLDAAARTLTLNLANAGRSSAHLQLFPYSGDLAKPKHYDVQGRRTDAIALKGDRYDLTLVGPNGFRREFAGSTTGAAATAEVSSRIRATGRVLDLELTNHGRETVTFKLTANGYGRDRTVTVRPGRDQSVNWSTAGDDGWYDVTITLQGTDGFTRRLAGHIENGRESVSG
ncbi:phosphocholine-specific phospholipase C [Embleya sp. NBC_00896]|uniref:phosphocholine-specific phospholipase C n=1 Tax=Embleya sp. NBC_00896 TaxID=2975961 RepID=UPI002F90FE3A|nr:phospholipase C, phosphocholine-specific [Embleya sp. NBC_00896]